MHSRPRPSLPRTAHSTGRPKTCAPCAVAEPSAEVDRQYEGCLSFFDVRGLVPRPLHIVIAHTELDGIPRPTRFDHGLACLFLHELDHFDGKLYRSRLIAGTPSLITVTSMLPTFSA
ncbi:peptide deformylase [Streptomyces coelicoflavus]|nr:peptide deformylase [Streptomyces coelicoflavus]